MSQERQAICWMLLMGMVSITINSIAKHLVQFYHPCQLMFFYCAYGVMVLLPFYGVAMEKSQTTARTKKLRMMHAKFHLLRAVMEFIAFSLIFYSIANLPLPTQTSIGYSSPIFASIFAVVFLKEHMTWNKIAALALGMLGVCIISDPFDHELTLPWLAIGASLLASVLFGACGTIIKRTTRGEKPIAIAFKMLFLASIISLPFAIATWKPLELETLAWLLALGFLTASVQYIVARAMQLGSVTTLAPLAYVNLIWSALSAYFFFDEIITLRTILGACFIVVATLITARRPSRLKPVIIT